MHLVSIMNMQTVFEILKASSELNQQVIKGHCLDYAAKYYTEFIANKEGARTMGIDLFQVSLLVFFPLLFLMDSCDSLS
jgi:hypothetical protein